MPQESHSFKNLSNLQLDANLCELLDRGPKFSLTRKITNNVLKEVESGIERGAYALRWKVSIENRRQQHRQQHQQQGQQQQHLQQQQQQQQHQQQHQQHQQQQPQQQ